MMNALDMKGVSNDSANAITNDVIPPSDENDAPTQPREEQDGAAINALKQGGDFSHQTNSIVRPQDPKAVDVTTINKSEDAEKPSTNTTTTQSSSRDGIKMKRMSSVKMKRLSSSVEGVDLEYSLGSLDSPIPQKRQCFSVDPSSAPSSTASKKKKLSPHPPIKSLAEAMKPKFWQDSASVSENNIAAASFDVAEEEGGSSPLSCTDEVEGKTSSSLGARKRLSDEEKRNIFKAEDVMRVAALAASESPPAAADSENLGDVSKGKTEEGGEAMDDFDRQVKLGMQDTCHDELNSNVSSASSLVDSYLAEEDESRPLPPAPPSTPAAANKDSFTPLPYQHDITGGGELSYGDELRRDELKCSGQSPFDADTATPTHDDLLTVPPPPFSMDEEAEMPLPDAKAPASQTEKYFEDMSGAVTEPRRGGAGARQAGGPMRRTMTKSDFDKWDVGDRYELKRMLGRGSYGEVAQAIDLHAIASRPGGGSKDQTIVPHHSAYVAVKKISKAFDQEVDAIRLFREVHILRRLRGHACIIQLIDVVQPRSSDLDHFNDLYLVFEYVDTDLYKLIMSPQYLTTEHIQTFLYQMIVGLKYIHSSSVIHRDLKPAILLNEDCTLKICDFGLARIVHNNKISSSTTTTEPLRNYSDIGVTDTNNDVASTQAAVHFVTNEASHLAGIQPRPNLARQLTKHVVTRWYRAPELILIQPYNSAVDIWSLGCIFAELLSMQEGSVPTYQERVPLFPGGSCYPLSGDHGSADSDERLDQLSVIFSVIGIPSEEDLKSVGKANEYIKSLEKKPGRNLESLYPAADTAAINLLKKMLMFNPAKRCTAEEALDHDFLKPVRRKEIEVCAHQPLESPEFLEERNIEMTTLKEETFKEVQWYKHTH